ncbi:hypothetical protein Pint_10470 [Pistacia integerrima]|uniref:Uncharacterized protein n=1 Tax=Pistacia integerrima TaxID=434235 RepID=A0ACC0XJ89_9ROSI|nr:hypothetical protein Pint_10470 [Pistacia integerrima]
MFVKFDPAESSDEKRYSGFCIDLFREVLKHLDYTISCEFVPHNDSYDDLIMGVYHKYLVISDKDCLIFWSKLNGRLMMPQNKLREIYSAICGVRVVADSSGQA